MEAKRLTLILSFLFIMGNIVRAKTTFRKFTQAADLYDSVCSAEDQLFHEERMSKMQCLSLCAENFSCFVVFHDKVSQHCVGCRVSYFSSTDQLVYGMHFNRYAHHKYTVVTEFKSYDQAKARCQEMGAHLAYIKSNDEQNFIEEQVIGAFTSNLWIGASGSDGVIYWADNTTVAMTSTGDNYENWADGEPNAPFGEDCVILHYPSQWTWHDDNCDYVHLSLCEFE